MFKSNINNLKTSGRMNKVTTPRLENDLAASSPQLLHVCLRMAAINPEVDISPSSLSLPPNISASEATRQDRNEAFVNSALELSAGIQVFFSRF